MFFYVWYKLVIGDGSRPVKGFCSDLDDMNNNTCVLSVGQISFGIFSIGQVSVGLITIGQCCIGILFCLGQACGSWFLTPFAQLAVTGWIWCCQLGVASLRVKYAQVGLSVLRPFMGGKLGTYIGQCGDNA